MDATEAAGADVDSGCVGGEFLGVEAMLPVVGHKKASDHGKHLNIPSGPEAMLQFHSDGARVRLPQHPLRVGADGVCFCRAGVVLQLPCSTGSYVALKVLSKELVAAEEDDAYAELSALGALSEPGLSTSVMPGIVAWDYHEDEENVYIAMEWAEGGSLHNFTVATLALLDNDAHVWWESFAPSIALQVCEAAAYLHERGVAHMDLDPRNIVVFPGPDATSAEGLRVAIVDYGSARFVDEHGYVGDGDFSIKGLPSYMSPQEISRLESLEKPAILGCPADVHHIGGVFWYLLAMPVAAINEVKTASGVVVSPGAAVQDRCGWWRIRLLRHLQGCHDDGRKMPAEDACYDPRVCFMCKYAVSFPAVWEDLLWFALHDDDKARRPARDLATCLKEYYRGAHDEVEEAVGEDEAVASPPSGSVEAVEAAVTEPAAGAATTVDEAAISEEGGGDAALFRALPRDDASFDDENRRFTGDSAAHASHEELAAGSIREDL